jgi:hypothetical protein
MPSLQGGSSGRTEKPNTDKSTMKSYLDKPSKYTQYIPPTEKAPLPSGLDPSRRQPFDNISPKTAFTSSHDITMATRQIRYETLPPHEQKKQEEWAQKKAQKLGPCPMGFEWERVSGGYNCSAGNHWITDALLAEEKGGFLALKTWMDEHPREPTPDLSGSEIFKTRQNHRAIGFSHGLGKFSGPFYSTDEFHEARLKHHDLKSLFSWP